MGNCKISTKKFKEFQLAAPNGELTPSNNSYFHDTANEIFLVGYQYRNENYCPEVKMRLTDVMSGSGGGSQGGGDSFNPGWVTVQFTGDEYAGAGSWSYNNDEWNMVLTMPKLIRDAEVRYDATTTAYVEKVASGFSGKEIKLVFHLLPNGGGDPLAIEYVTVNQQVGNTPHGEYDSATNTLALYLEPGPSGQDGEDGATVDIYKVVLTVSSSSKGTPAQGQTADDVPYTLTTSSRAWSKFNPSTGNYDTINSAPTIQTGQVVEVGLPDTTTPSVIAKNLMYGVFGIYNGGVFTFYSIKEIDSSTSITVSVKVYKNLDSADSNSQNVNPSQNQ